MSPFRPSMSVLSSSNQMAPWRVTLGFCLWVFFFLCNGSAQASFLETPSLEWSVTLPDNPTIGDNNVVQVWNNHILVTTAAGNLYMLDRRTGDSLGVFEASNNNGAVICKSGITIVSTLTTAEEASSDYAVYAVIDTTAATSQVIAVNIPDATLRWSMEVSGEITGTPVVGRSEDSRLIYVSHTTTTNENRSRGVLSVLQINDDHTQATIVANALSSPNPNVPALGPPTLQRLSTNPESIAATTTLNNGGDFVAVAENWNPNTGINLDNGAIYILGPSSNTFDPTNLGPESFEWRTVSDSVWSFGALAAPLFVDNSIYMGGTAAIIAGWTDNRDISSVLVQDGNNEDDVPPRWILQLNRNNNNADLPFATSPTVTPDGSQLYIIGPSNRVYNIQTETGRVQWEFLLDDAVQSQPIIYQNEDSLALYVVEARTGRILQFPLDPDNNLIAQEPVWSWELCQDGGDETDIVIEDCTTNHVVQADVSMAESGNILYYGDVNGRITALQVANFATPAPTMSPSATPTMLPSATPTLSMEPTAMNITDTPTESPTAAPTRTQAITATFAPVNGPTTVVGTPTAPVFDTNNGNASVGNKDVDDDDDSSNMGILIGAIVGGVAVILVVAMLVAKNLLRPKRSRKSSKRIPAGATRDLESDIAPKDGPSDEEDDEVYDYNAEDDDDDDDDVTVISGNGDSVELEYNAANAAKGAAKGSGRRCRTPRKKKMSPAKMTRVSTPPTASTLQSIEEVLSEEEKVIDSRKNLNPQFRSVMDDEESAASSEVSSVIPPPPPPSTVPRERTTNEEEKKDPESPRPSHTDMDIKSPVSPASTTSSNGAFLDSVSRALGYVSANASNKEAKEQQEIPAIQPVLSNDSSIYTNNNDEKSKMTTDSSSPLSGVFGEMPNKAKHTLAGPDQDARDSLSMSALDHHTSTPRAPLGGPAQYLAKGSRPRFKPAGKEHVPKVKSARTTRNLAGFTPSYLTQPEDEDDSNLARNRSNESVNKQQARDPKAAPTFKRRTKPDASSSSMADAVGDTWNSFLDELAAAEEKFFAPTPAQKSAVLRYNKDDESTLGPSTIDDAGDEEDDDEDVFSDGDETVKTGVKA